jgi:hypothetical protein
LDYWDFSQLLGFVWMIGAMGYYREFPFKIIHLESCGSPQQSKACGELPLFSLQYFLSIRSALLSKAPYRAYPRFV